MKKRDNTDQDAKIDALCNLVKEKNESFFKKMKIDSMPKINRKKKLELTQHSNRILDQ